MIDFQPTEPESSPAPALFSVNIARMRHSDIEVVTRLEAQVQALAWSANAYVTEINNPNAYYAIAKTQDGELAGYGGIWVVMDEMHITNIVTNPKLRGLKIGERLLIVLIEEGLRRKATRGTLEVRERNVVAQNLYKKYGFATVAMRRRYYSDNHENAFIMWAENIGGNAYKHMLTEARARLFR
jgi:ribosomal-protein-alanine N-acetyltransferase